MWKHQIRLSYHIFPVWKISTTPPSTTKKVNYSKPQTSMSVLAISFLFYFPPFFIFILHILKRQRRRWRRCPETVVYHTSHWETSTHTFLRSKWYRRETPDHSLIFARWRDIRRTKYTPHLFFSTFSALLLPNGLDGVQHTYSPFLGCKCRRLRGYPCGDLLAAELV